MRPLSSIPNKSQTQMPPSNTVHLYLLMDTSASMTGAGLEALKQGVRLLSSTFSGRGGHPILCAGITYDSTARIAFPLTPIDALHPPNDLDSGGTSALGAALGLLKDHFAPRRPALVYIFSDGEPTDDWQRPLAALRPHVTRIIGLACGLAVNDDAFASFTDEAHWLSDLTPEALRRTLTL
ncbi:MAG: VWA domain-containing protein [Anaerolineales bacterium]|nr:VWA domain-containing protein [Anaerolineales bacterium]